MLINYAKYSDRRYEAILLAPGEKKIEVTIDTRELLPTIGYKLTGLEFLTNYF